MDQKRLATSTLAGPALDWAAALAFVTDACLFRVHDGKVVDRLGQAWEPSRNWSQAGPLIEEYGVELNPPRSGRSILTQRGEPVWGAHIMGGHAHYAPTPLVAAMRCFVEHRLGKSVRIPAELAMTSLQDQPAPLKQARAAQTLPTRHRP